jgi:hypothetical protein
MGQKLISRQYWYGMPTHVSYAMIFIVATFCYLINILENSSGKGVFTQYKMCFFKKKLQLVQKKNFEIKNMKDKY